MKKQRKHYTPVENVAAPAGSSPVPAGLSLLPEGIGRTDLAGAWGIVLGVRVYSCTVTVNFCANFPVVSHIVVNPIETQNTALNSGHPTVARRRRWQ